MPKEPRPPVPVNIITGSLGVGKTTALNSLLERRPQQESWSVLVNEYGLVGLDAAILEDPSRRDVEIKEVAGGCICCTAGFLFEMYLVLLLQRRPARLLIEPTGLAELTGILETLARPGIAESVDLRSVICLLDPRTYQQDILRDEVRDQVESCDIVLGSRVDLASQDELHGFESWAKELFPPKRHIGRIERGNIPLELLDLVDQSSAAVLRPATNAGPREARHLSKHRETHGHEHNHDHHHGHEHNHAHDHHHVHEHHDHSHAPSEPKAPEASNPIVAHRHSSTVCTSLGWTCWQGLEFQTEPLTQWLTSIASKATNLRVKASIRTQAGWKIYNLAGAAQEIRKTGPKRESRLELLFDPKAAPAPEELEAQLRALSTAAETPPA